ncbi:di-heme enzyme [Hahella sp. CCB-MM4]|nr:di-heme enzyme [Hahella sp. CCB-MM4]
MPGLFLIAVVALLTACGGESKTTFDDLGVNRTAFNWYLPDSAPLPVEPEINPMTEAKFQLGRHLFYDRRLSGNGTQSCADCHQQSIGFTDGLAVSVGSTGELHPRNAQPLLNVAYNATLTWGNPSLRTLEQQILVPLFGEFPVEQGINDGNQEQILERLRDESRYQELFPDAFPEQGDPIDYNNIVFALASFVRGMVSFNSDFDRYERGDSSALSASAKRGRQLFFGEDMECFHCHGGYNFSDSTFDRTQTFIERPFHNTGLFNINGTGAFPENNRGVFEVTEDPSDMGKFRAPTLRNIALTAPYMHDGSMNSLEDVIEFYAAGGRNIESGPNAGDGRFNPFKDGFVTGFEVTNQEKADLIAFLNSLTDETYLANDRFSNPWSTP